ncbi:hypothetical protein Tc00.1047053506965.160 [Trypanosoma cruzi]|uniref:Uncharacterized protein n=1 Tax=Trypanosoma cruzi (strain CL Brener) TaxID=353153 RepID=Q4DIE6_TRYCC|nr:hypothetical protein Tc00.1047053506965.160 [Trypanosoma cruzi]EAN92304.1 hypothetical protein Tc00.1047053506965.160 [Trypanosoma cruzi]|eukprot:XP_814155.1 hypothetical protein [Trypanosoma cruzi strain CL Brener]
MHGRNGELGAVCHVANAVHTCSNCAASCATKEEGATVAFTMNVTTHKYAGPYELWWRQFSPDGTIHPPARSGDADQTGICQLPSPREGKDDTKSGETTAPQVNAEPSRQHEDWRQSAAADGPNTVDRSPASNKCRKKFRIATDPKENVAPTPPKRRPSIATSRNIEMDPNAFETMTAPATALRISVGSKDARKSEAVDGSGEHFSGEIAGGMNGHNVSGKNKAVSRNVTLHDLERRECRGPPRPVWRREVDTMRFNWRPHCACVRVSGVAAAAAGAMWSCGSLSS